MPPTRSSRPCRRPSATSPGPPTRLALVALTGDFGNVDHSIYVIPLATGVPALVFTDAANQRINLENGISWQPGGTKLLFTASMPFDPAAPNASITQQLFTVPTTGGAATQFFVPSAAPTDPQYRFGTPEWAPDGTRIAVWVQENGTVPSPYQDTYLSVMTTGVAPSSLRDVHVIPTAASGPYWSTDGAAVLFSDVPAGPGPAPATVIAATGGAPLGTYAYGGQITDWQPCPTGACAVWGLHTARTLSLQASRTKITKGRKVTFTGAVVRRWCVGLHGRSAGRPAEGGDRQGRDVRSPGLHDDRRCGSVHDEGQGPQDGAVPDRGHRGAGLPGRDLACGEGQDEGPTATTRWRPSRGTDPGPGRLPPDVTATPAISRADVGLRSERGPILLAVMLSVGLVAIDATILATAVPAVVGDLGGFTQFPWLFSVYLLTQAVSVPLYSKLADQYGRKPMMLVGVGIFLGGSLLCGLAWSMTSLIAFRAVQGIGAGAVQPIGMTIVGDIYSIEERAKVQGYLAGVWALASVVGPTLGGVFSDYLSWRWIFFVNLPIGAAALLDVRPQVRGARGEGVAQDRCARLVAAQRRWRPLAPRPARGRGPVVVGLRRSASRCSRPRCCCWWPSCGSRPGLPSRCSRSGSSGTA